MFKISKFPIYQTSKYWISGLPDFKVPKYWKPFLSDFPISWISVFPIFRCFEFPNFRFTKLPKYWISGLLDFKVPKYLQVLPVRARLATARARLVFSEFPIFQIPHFPNVGFIFLKENPMFFSQNKASPTGYFWTTIFQISNLNRIFFHHF